jgi:alkylhydroperoxidase family enzyme
VSDADLSTARQAGVTDAEIAEVVGVVSLNLFTNYFNHVADPQIDFPVVQL